MENAVRPTDLAEAVGISVPYASQLLSGRRNPPLSLALRIFAEFGVKLGLLAEATAEQIAVLQQLAPGAATEERAA